MSDPIHNASVDDLSPGYDPAVIAIGNFDGVHPGHVTLFDQARRLADRDGLACIALTFDPHPRQFFAGEPDPFLIQPVEQRARMIIEAGMDRVIILRFDGKLADMAPNDFIDDILINRLSARHIVVGDDFTFGHRAAGDIHTLRRADAFDTHVMPLLSGPHGDLISSTRIRGLIRDGNIPAAANLLGHPWVLSGRVVRGDNRGTAIGFPTANVAYPDDVIRPPFGVYAVRIQIDGIWHDGVANIGIRPTYPLDHPMVEVYIFNFDRDIYGQNVRVAPVEMIRAERQFDGPDALKKQLEQDTKKAEKILRHAK